MKCRLAILVLLVAILAGCRGMLPRAKIRPAAAAPPEQVYTQLKARQGGLSAFAAKGASP